MDDQKFEELAKNWPDLMQKSEQDYLGVGNGWYNILDILCGLISYRVNQARHKLKYAMENQGGQYAKPIPEAEAELAAAIEALPTIVQIKEKFGGLRFYVHGGTEEMGNYITFAESMAYRTCEECGAPGEARNDGWVKVLCDKHHKERQQKSEPGLYPRKTKTAPKLSDE